MSLLADLLWLTLNLALKDFTPQKSDRTPTLNTSSAQISISSSETDNVQTIFGYYNCLETYGQTLQTTVVFKL
jgi:hypothetical protein